MAKATAEIRSLARGHTRAAITTLAAIMNQKKAPAAARVSAAKELMDRGWGKAPQSLQHSGNIGTYDLTKVSDGDIDTLERIIRAASVTGGGDGGEGEAED